MTMAKRKPEVDDVTKQQEALIEEKRTEIRDAMRNLGRAIQSGDERELIHWVIPGDLAVAHRPLRYHAVYGGSRTRLPQDAAPLVADWVDLLKVEGIRSILSLMHNGDTNCYRELALGDGDFLGYLESQGFVVARHPYEDPAHKHTPAPQARKLLVQIRAEALSSFDQLPKPVVMLCSAGQDRSAPVAAFIESQRGAMTTWPGKTKQAKLYVTVRFARYVLFLQAL